MTLNQLKNASVQYPAAPLSGRYYATRMTLTLGLKTTHYVSFTDGESYLDYNVYLLTGKQIKFDVRSN